MSWKVPQIDLESICIKQFIASSVVCSVVNLRTNGGGQLEKEKRCSLFRPCLKFHYHVQRKHPISYFRGTSHKFCKLRDGYHVREVNKIMYFPTTKCLSSGQDSGTLKLCLRFGSFARKLKD